MLDFLRTATGGNLDKHVLVGGCDDVTLLHAIAVLAPSKASCVADHHPSGQLEVEERTSEQVREAVDAHGFHDELAPTC